MKKVTPFSLFSFEYCLTRNTSFINLLLLWIIMHFQIKKISSFNLLLVGFDFAILCICFLRVLFCISAYMKLQIGSYFYICIASYWASYRIIMLNITSFFLVSEETKFEVDTTSIVLSYLYHFGNVNLVALKAKFWYSQDVNKNPI